jgi:hypothetical protein
MKPTKIETGWYFVKKYYRDDCYYWIVAFFSSGEYWETRLPFNNGLGERFDWDEVHAIKPIGYPE